MKRKFCIVHEIPGRIRVLIDSLNIRKDHKEIEVHFKSLLGVKNVRLEPLISSMAVEYDATQVTRDKILLHITVFFQQTCYSSVNEMLARVSPSVRRDLFSSLVSGVLLFVSMSRRTNKLMPDMLDYIVMIATAYTVLSHGGKDKLKHPDVIAGFVSMLSLGPNKMLQSSAIAWGVNLLEIFLEMKQGKALCDVRR